jgi:transcriptional/translational regulatory protein YebC/TACO1
MEVALEAGAEDIINDEDGSIEVITPPHEFIQVKEALLKANLKIELAEVAMRPTLENALSGDDGIKMQKILDTLDDLDDVQEVYTTAVIED